MATLSLTVASCDFCSSDRRFASAFLQIPLALIIVVAMKRTPLVLAVSFPLLGRIRNFHPLVTCAARRTKKTGIAFFHAIPVSFFIYHLFTVKYFDMMFYILICSKYHCLIHIKVIMCTFCCQIVFYFFCQALKACCCNIDFADSK